MIKIKFKIYWVLILFSIFSFYKTSFADNDYYIDDFKIDMYIGSEGNVRVSETLTYKFSEKSNGITRSIYSKGIKVDDLKVYSIYPERKELEIDIFNELNIIDFRIYDKSTYGTKIFKIEYNLKDAVVSYNDISEFLWKFIDEDNTAMYKNLNINIYMPQIDKAYDLRAFQHGYLYRNFKIKNNTISSTIQNLPLNTELRFRILIPTELVKNNSKNINKYVYDKTIREEKISEDKVNKKVKTIRLFNNIGLYLLLMESITPFIIYCGLYNRNSKTFRKKNYNKPPNNYSPAIISCIVNSQKVYPKDVIATLLNLVRKKCIHIKSVNNTDIKDYTLELIENNLINLEDNEKYLINWIFYSIGCNKYISLRELQIFNRNKKNFSKFKNYYYIWKNKVVKECELYGYFKRKNTLYSIIMIFIPVLQIVSGITGIYLYGSYADKYIFYILGTICILIYSRIFKRSRLGYKEYKNWMRFKQFLIKFKSIRLNLLDNLLKWEYYLICSISLNTYKKTIIKFKYTLKKEQINVENLYISHILDEDFINLLEKSFKIGDLNKNFKFKKLK